MPIACMEISFGAARKGAGKPAEYSPGKTVVDRQVCDPVFTNRNVGFNRDAKFRLRLALRSLGNPAAPTGQHPAHARLPGAGR
jgi:hypothetical protein